MKTYILIHLVRLQAAYLDWFLTLTITLVDLLRTFGSMSTTKLSTTDGLTALEKSMASATDLHQDLKNQS